MFSSEDQTIFLIQFVLLSCQQESIRFVRHVRISFEMMVRYNCLDFAMGNINHGGQHRQDLFETVYKMNMKRSHFSPSLSLKKVDDHYSMEGSTQPASLNSRGQIDNERLLYMKDNQYIDRRRKIPKDTLQEYPYNLVGSVVAQADSCVSYCSGTLLSSNAVLTTAHSFAYIDESKNIIECVPKQLHLTFYDHQNKSISQRIYRVKHYRINEEYMNIQREIARKELQLINLKSILTGQEYAFFENQANQSIPPLVMKEIDCDYALLKLEETVRRDRYLPLSIAEREKIYRGRIIGCQQKKGEFSKKEVVYYEHEGDVTISENNQMLYDIDTQHQQSGSSVIVNFGKNERIVGIHKGSYLKKKMNLGVFLTVQIIEQLKRWTEELGCQQFTIDNSIENMDGQQPLFLQQRSNHSLAYQNPQINVDQHNIIIQFEQEQIPKRKSARMKRKSERIVRESQQITESIQQLRRALQIADPQGYIAFLKRNFAWNQQLSKGFIVQGKKIRKRRNEYQQITGRDPLPTSGRYEVTFRIQEYGRQKSDIYLGIITKNRLSSKWSGGETKDKYLQIQSIGYLTYHNPSINKLTNGEGGIIIDGIYYMGGFRNLLPELYIEKGGQLKMELDLDKSEITYTNSNGAYTIPIPLQYHNHNLYICVSCGAKNTTIEVLE